VTYADLNALGMRRRAEGDLAGAREAFRRAIALAPHEPEPHHHLAGVLILSDERQAAEAEYREALELAPGSGPTARALAQFLLADGRYQEGFALWERRHDLAERAKPSLPFPEWRGEPVAGKKLLIWPEQGFGDQIMFARFAPALRDSGADVTLLCWPGLTRLFDDSLGVRVLPASGAVEFPDPDFWVMTMTLAGRMGASPQTLPAPPYLRATGSWPALPAGLKVGLATVAGAHLPGASSRSLPDDQALRLKALPAQIIDLSPASTGARDFADTAAIVEQLDLVISVDTSMAHLAGGMGKPCWVLVPTPSDWRWMHSREDSPWYPTARVYRQPTPGDWASMVDRVIEDFERLAKA
jgi:tetratricopeptide (TPR) repeat protein